MVICESFAAIHYNILFSGEPILNSFALRTVTATKFTKFELRDFSMHYVSIHSSEREQSETLTNIKTTIPSIVTPTTLSPSISDPPFMICTPILIVVCCPNLTIYPARQFQHN